MENLKEVFNFVKETVTEVNKPELEKQKFMNTNPVFNQSFNAFIEKKFPEEYKTVLSEGGLKQYIIGDEDFFTKFALHSLTRIVKGEGSESEDVVKQGKEMLKTISEMTEEKSQFMLLLDAYKTLYETDIPLNENKFKEFFVQNGIPLENNQTVSIDDKTIDLAKREQERSADDEEDFEDNKEYNYDFKKNSKFSDTMEKYISFLPMFTSVGYQKDPQTGTTLCSRTAAEDAKKLYGLDWEKGNAFDVMRAKDKKFNTSIVSDLYKEKEGSIDIKTDTICNKEDMGKSEYINNVSGDNNVVDLYVTSSTAKGKKYGHRATMFRIGDQWFVIDPYTVLQPGEQKNKPRTLESYALSMKTGNNKREFMRMDFYKSESLDNKVSSVFNNKNDLSAVA